MTLSPSVLSVRGTTNPEIELLPNGSVGNADLRFDGTTFDLRSNSSSASLLLSTNSTERMRNTNSSVVGIGTSSPAGGLHVANSFIRVDNSEGIAAKKVRSSYFSTSQNLTLETNAAANIVCLIYTSPRPRAKRQSRMPSSA